jgi:hypothetical protein
MATLLPAELDAVKLSQSAAEGFVAQPTEIGLRTASLLLADSISASRTLWSSLAPLYWFAELDQSKPTASALLTHPTRTGATGQLLPVVAMHYVGRGRVVMHATDETWRWRFRTGEEPFARYWGQTVRMLSRAKLSSRGGAELATDRREYRQTEPARARVRFFDENAAPVDESGVTIMLESPGLSRRRILLERSSGARGIFTTTINDLPVGQYRATVVDPLLTPEPPSTQFRVISSPGELARLEMDRSALVAAAENTGGKYYGLAEAKSLVDDLPPGRPVPLENLPPITVWNHWWLLAALLGLLTTEWVLRRRKGML